MKPSSLLVLAIALSPAAFAQSPPADSPKPATPQSEAGEPRAHTSAQAEAGEPRANTSPQAEAGEPRAQSVPASPGRSAESGKIPAKAAAPVKGGNDRLQLQTATVTGDREQPKVMYVVPWKRSDIGDLEGKPMNSLVDEILSPVDREVFRREVSYYQTVNADAQASKATPGQVEK